MNDINELIVVNKSLEQQNFITEFVTFMEEFSCMEEFSWNPEDTKDEIIDSKINELDDLTDKWVHLFRMELITSSKYSNLSKWFSSEDSIRLSRSTQERNAYRIKRYWKGF